MADLPGGTRGGGGAPAHCLIRKPERGDGGVTAIAIEDRGARLGTWLTAHRELVVVYSRSRDPLDLLERGLVALPHDVQPREPHGRDSLALALVAIGQTFVVLTGGHRPLGRVDDEPRHARRRDAHGREQRPARHGDPPGRSGSAPRSGSSTVSSIGGPRRTADRRDARHALVVEGLALWRSEAPDGKTAPGLEVGRLRHGRPDSDRGARHSRGVRDRGVRPATDEVRAASLRARGQRGGDRLSGVGTARLKVSVYVVCGLFAACRRARSDRAARHGRSGGRAVLPADLGRSRRDRRNEPVRRARGPGGNVRGRLRPHDPQQHPDAPGRGHLSAERDDRAAHHRGRRRLLGCSSQAPRRSAGEPR